MGKEKAAKEDQQSVIPDPLLEAKIIIYLILLRKHKTDEIINLKIG
jgi:hypothetical protein